MIRSLARRPLKKLAMYAVVSTMSPGVESGIPWWEVSKITLGMTAILILVGLIVRVERVLRMILDLQAEIIKTLDFEACYRYMLLPSFWAMVGKFWVPLRKFGTSKYVCKDEGLIFKRHNDLTGLLDYVRNNSCSISNVSSSEDSLDS